MGRRYYCDYCDKSFIDDLEARRKHLQSSHHIKLRNLHYEYSRDPATILREELLKTPCKRFEQYGLCQFAGNCKYTHYSPEELVELRHQVEYLQQEQQRKLQEIPEIPSLESWLDKYNEKTNKKDSNIVKTFWTYPDQLELRPDIPPSMKKMKPEHFSSGEFEEWGK